MNLFRSKEHLRNWSLFNPNSEDSILPVEDWAYVVAGPLFRERLEPDILAHTDEYWDDFCARLAELGRSGSIWR
jgi:hypothetical protein